MRKLQDKMDNALVVKIHKDAHTFLWLCLLLNRVENMLSMDTPSGSLHSLVLFLHIGTHLSQG